MPAAFGSWRRAVAVGAVAGVIVLYLIAVGIVLAFAERNLITGFVTLGRLMLSIPPLAAGYATVFGCTAAIPTASNLNYSIGQTIANDSIVMLSPAGDVCIYTDAAAHLLVDANGYLPAGSRVGTVAPARLLDTRLP